MKQRLLLVLAALAVLVQSASAQLEGAPQLIDYQGRVLDADGNPVATGTPQQLLMYFRIWDHLSDSTATSRIWSEQQIVTVFEGNFSVQLGKGSAIPSESSPDLADAFDGSTRYLELSVSVDSTTPPSSPIQPRLAFLSSPFSLVAERAVRAEFGPANGTFEADAVGVGTSDPITPLHVEGKATVGDAFVPSGATAGNVINLLTGSDSAGGTNGISFWENPTFAMSLGFDGSNDALSFYDSSGDPLLSLLDSGNIGVGTISPDANLHVVAADEEMARVFATGSAAGGGMFFAGESTSEGGGLLFEGDSTPAEVGDPGDVVFFRRIGGLNHEVFSYSASESTVHFEGDLDPAGNVSAGGGGTFVGNVGVGTTSPQHKLHVVGNAYASGNSYTNGKVGIGTTAPAQKLHVVGDAVIDGKLGVGTNAPESPLHVDGIAYFDGKVGVGTADPEVDFHIYRPDDEVADLALSGDIQGTARLFLGQSMITGGGLIYNGDDVPNVIGHKDNITFFRRNGGANHVVSRYAYNSSTVYFTVPTVGHSDARIKSPTGISDTAADLDKLMHLEVTDYTYRDSETYGDRPQKMLVAQQVEKVFPQAVTQDIGVVPDIYQSAIIRDGWIQLDAGLSAGDKVKLRSGGSEGTYEVRETRDGAFLTDFETDSAEVFVYGREVDDFRSLCYDAISMLNVSATQELHHQLQQKDERISALESRLVEIEAMLNVTVK